MKLGVLSDPQRALMNKLGFTFESVTQNNGRWTEVWKFWDENESENRRVNFDEVEEVTGYGKNTVKKTKMFIHIPNKVSIEIITKIAQVVNAVGEKE